MPAIEERFEEKLISLGHALPAPPPAVGSYVPFVQVGEVLYLSGTLPITKDKSWKGKVGDTRSVEEAQEAARCCVLNALAQVKAATGSLETIKQFIFLDGFVNATAGFDQSPQVLNGASDLLVDVFGEVGKHARAAVVVTGLPLNATVELKLTVCLRSF